jgi:hypothetical protein
LRADGKDLSSEINAVALFSHFTETVEKGPPLAGFFVLDLADPDPQSPVAKFPFLARFRAVFRFLESFDIRPRLPDSSMSR